MNESFLATRRIEIGLSQKDIADQLGYSVQSVSQWENGKSFPALSIWGSYASLLRIDLNGFLLEKNQKDNSICDDLKFNNDVFAHKLKYLRKKHNYNQQQLAVFLNVSKHSIIAYEKGLSTPNKEQFIALCNLYSISANGLYFSIDEQGTPKKVGIINNKKVLLPIFIPVLIVLVIGGGTGIVLTAHQRNAINKNNSSSEYIKTFEPTIRYIEYGLYPQTIEDNETIINSLDNIAPNELGVYQFDDCYYYKLSAFSIPSYEESTASFPTSFSNGQPIETGVSYYFKMEPIKWQVLEETNVDYFLYSDIVLDTHSFDLTSNNYKDSSIRSFLNSDFYKLAFFIDDTKIAETKVDNSLASTLDANNENICENTFDKVFLASQADIYNENYDFGATFKKPSFSDFASAKRILVHKYATPKTAVYWLRSPGVNPGTVKMMYASVGGDEYGINPTFSVGVRPMIRLKK